MRTSTLARCLLAAALACRGALAGAMTVAPDIDARRLAERLAGPGIALANPTLEGASANAAGTFAGAAGAIGFADGVLLTTGTVQCAPGPNNSPNCSGGGSTSSLKFDFTTQTGKIYLRYVFASEEYNEYANSNFNDTLEVLLNGRNIALMGNGRGISVNSINKDNYHAFFRDNTVLGLDTQYDGLSTILDLSASNLSGSNSFEVRISDANGDPSYDSAVLLPSGALRAIPPVPEAAGWTLLLAGLGLLGGVARRAKRRRIGAPPEMMDDDPIRPAQLRARTGGGRRPAGPGQSACQRVERYLAKLGGQSRRPAGDGKPART